jgi:hypothetical protein
MPTPSTPDRIADGLLNATLPQAAWTHAAHVQATYALCRRVGPDAALDAVRDAIPRLNDSHGVPNSDDDGYHETITVFFVSAVADCVARGLDADATLRALPATEPLRYWTRGVLFAVAARRRFVAPDAATPRFVLIGVPATSRDAR